ncbi:3-oxoacyl-[acyl-carrier-protein] FabG [Cyphellophora attinorum]|uniref:3-oxoacyl-[acyl-carrier-protein] FabG n=1 Tax=Cyphellophora attinorum TaxID=1664694 RepID=A0A0N1HBE9_9EURO|nr:3-oxoacyl-[acyl-carrier-protein] FabG [Phialophora attinorum]KPI45897.1 3-oxoacyl-[acyl-carrier-protein] FabG [Phialophora attinorum]
MQVITAERPSARRTPSTNIPREASYRPHEGKFAIITGGSRGIGAAIAKNLAVKGCSLLLIDILINCAGIAGNKSLNDTKLGPIEITQFNAQYHVNVLAPLLLTQAAEPYLPKDRSGRIVNVSSVSASIGCEGQSIYAGTKAALEAMTRVHARELASRATVNAINPGPVWGDMYAQAGKEFWDVNQKYVDGAPLMDYEDAEEHKVKAGGGEKGEEYDRIVREGMGGRRPAWPEEVAGVVGMLCSEDGGWCTGSVVCANGGMKMSIA